jgi:hypothetical protein
MVFIDEAHSAVVKVEKQYFVDDPENNAIYSWVCGIR